jgi:hypothetical protein
VDGRNKSGHDEVGRPHLTHRAGGFRRSPPLTGKPIRLFPFSRDDIPLIAKNWFQILLANDFHLHL